MTPPTATAPKAPHAAPPDHGGHGPGDPVPPSRSHGGHGGDAHSGDARTGGHGGRKHRHEEHAGHSVPPWLMSFGDMMTLFLCFFIILTTMADKQEGGLMAAGLGQFVSVLENHGALSGAMEGEQRLQAVNMYRERFGLPPEVESLDVASKPEPRDLHELEELVGKQLRPHAELPLPEVALFDADSAELSTAAKRYLDRIAETLRPGFGQVLVLDGHALDAGPRFREDDTLLALSRASAVRGYLVEQHEFVPPRIEVRAWPGELGARGGGSNVDARLIEPIRDGPASGGS
jgi:flagellar motor protein MotB